VRTDVKVWRKAITFLPDSSGTCETLARTQVTEASRLRNSWTLLTTSWSFCTREAMETFLSDRKAMLMHAETSPTTRWNLWIRASKSKQVYEVWETLELADKPV